MIVKTCIYCGVEFKVKPWKRFLKRKFCSKSCASKHTVENRNDDWRPDNKGENNPRFGATNINEKSLENLRSDYWKGKQQSKESNEKRSKRLTGIKRPKETLDKRRTTCLKKGLWRKPDDPFYVEFKKYRRKVYYWTNQQKLDNLDNIHKRGRKNGDYHLDHKFSIFEGFKQNIPPKIIGCIHNLQMIPMSDNVRKNTKCDLTKEELYELFESCD